MPILLQDNKTIDDDITLYLEKTDNPAPHLPLLSQNNKTVDDDVMFYLEKIENFTLQKFDKDQQISHFIKAKKYFSFKNSPALLSSPKVITYDKNGKKNYVLNANSANILNNGKIKFMGKIDISSTTGAHKINTKELILGTKTNDLIGNKKITYLGENEKITSQGITIHNKTNNDKNEQITKFLGKVKIINDSGSKINTTGLVVKQSKNGKIYLTKETTRYISKNTNIKSKGMFYDTKNQKIKLVGGVIGRYE